MVVLSRKSKESSAVNGIGAPGRALKVLYCESAMGAWSGLSRPMKTSSSIAATPEGATTPL